MKNILIGGAWPSVNGSLHIGHIAGLLPGDVLARYYRAKGDAVFYVSGSDCHGTPITIRAREEGSTPQEISERYHAENCRVFDALGFRFDLYGKTSAQWHLDFVRDFHEKMYSGGYVYEKTAPQAYCNVCQKALSDRQVVGSCPRCAADARGEQCDACDALLTPETLENPHCAQCGQAVDFAPSTHLYLALSRLAPQLRLLLNTRPHWRKNAVAFTKRYLDEGLPDRAITRDLPWGIDVPRAGFSQKKIYVWAENVLGYLSASAELAAQRGLPFCALWGRNARHYYVHGKDNIPFHTIMLPALLLAQGEGLRLPDDIISAEHLTLEGKRISTSRNWAVWAKDVAFQYNPDALRYFFLINGPEKRDTDFSWREFVTRNNSELLGAFGNFVNRTLAFIQKYQDGIAPNAAMDAAIQAEIDSAFAAVGEKIEAGEIKEALETAFALVRCANQYFDAQQPWKTRTSDPAACARTLYHCMQLTANLAALLAPFLPFACEKIRSWLGTELSWHRQTVAAGYELPELSLLFERLETPEDARIS